MSSDEIIYSINIEDIQTVATEELGRLLTEDELKIISNELGEYINWYDAIVVALINHIKIKSHAAS